MKIMVIIEKSEDGLIVKYKGLELPSDFQRRLVNVIGSIYSVGTKVNTFSDMIESEIPEEISPIIDFIENLMLNPANSAVSELYSFLRTSSLPITSDGYFLAYKKVRHNYNDIYSNTFSNKVGEKLEMERWSVDDNRQKTCSTGFHCCSFEYLKHYGSTSKDSHRIVVVKVNPKDVVSVPSHYNNQKMRVCKYTVVDEIPADSQGKIAQWYVPPVLEGKKIIQSDILGFKGMSKEITDYREETGKEALWTNSMFSGMPAYLISVHYPLNIFRHVHSFINLNHKKPVNYVFVCLLGFGMEMVTPVMPKTFAPLCGFVDLKMPLPEA